MHSCLFALTALVSGRLSATHLLTVQDARCACLLLRTAVVFGMALYSAVSTGVFIHAASHLSEENP